MHGLRHVAESCCEAPRDKRKQMSDRMKAGIKKSQGS
jgi:hypothetical protein